MFHRWAALVLVLALCATSPKIAAGQSAAPRGHGAKGKVGSNWPNPFNPDTKINFSVGEEGCAPGTERHVVTMRLLNILSQPVVSPQLYAASGTTSVSPALTGHPIVNMTLPCGTYVAYWDGKLTTGKEAPSGTYGVQLFVDNVLQPGTVRIFRSK